MVKKRLLFIFLSLVALTLAACGGNKEEEAGPLSEDKLVVGSMDGEQAKFLKLLLKWQQKMV